MFFFPARTSTVILENFYVQVANYFKNPSYKLVKKFSKSDTGLWSCSITVQWPFPSEFRADESKKTEAARVASLRTIEWLKVGNCQYHLPFKTIAAKLSNIDFLLESTENRR